MLGMKHCAPAIRDSGGGSIINISSTAGLTAHDDAAYTASKWGLRGLTKTAVLQFSAWNIRVNSIHPGQIADTGFFKSGGEAFAHAARTAIPLHRQGTPKECANLVLFLASVAVAVSAAARPRGFRKQAGPAERHPLALRCPAVRARSGEKSSCISRRSESGYLPARQNQGRREVAPLWSRRKKCCCESPGKQRMV